MKRRYMSPKNIKKIVLAGCVVFAAAQGMAQTNSLELLGGSSSVGSTTNLGLYYKLTPSGGSQDYLRLWPNATTGYTTFETSLGYYRFDKPLYIDGGILSSYSGNLIFKTAGTTNMVISGSSGFAGIGTTVPVSLLDIKNSSNTAELTVRGAGSDYASSNIVLKTISGTNWRGMGLYMHDLNGQTEWFAGRPYGDLLTSDAFVIFRKSGVADHSTTTGAIGNGSGGATGTLAMMTVRNDGKVGIGTTAPSTLLHVSANTASAYASTIENSNTTGNGLLIKAGGAGSNVNLLTVQDNAGGDILKLRGQDKTLYVRSLEVRIASFPDYVFEKNYSLMPLQQLESYILANKHLPNVPSAKEVEENGANVGELVKVQMEKIEELTLYLLEMNKQNQGLVNKVEALEQQNEEIEKELEKLKKQ